MVPEKKLSCSCSMRDRDLDKHIRKQEIEVAEAAARYGYGPLSNTSRGSSICSRFQYTQPASSLQGFANPAPLGLSAFALTTFVLSLINMQTRGSTAPNLVVASAFGYGGLVQLLAGMWEMAIGNTFGATALSSYGGFWISFGIIYTPGGFGILEAIDKVNGKSGINNTVGFWLMGWWIFTTILMLCTLKSNFAFFLMFLSLDLAFFCLGIGHLVQPMPGLMNTSLIKAGGFFGLVAAFLAWYNALAGIADENNSFIRFPLGSFPWSGTQKKDEQETV
ncbi:hypothetical protein FQN57_005306 [Myotisia sp. PD_48]|nr:hypothetical protein FQN57_005306 [Myotisia sp. PD_48]